GRGGCRSEAGRRGRRGRVLDVGDGGRAGRYVARGVGRGCRVAGRGVVGDADGQPGRGKRRRAAGGRGCAAAVGCRVDLDCRAGLGAAGAPGRVVVGRRAGRGGEARRRGGRGRVLGVGQGTRARRDVAGPVGRRDGQLRRRVVGERDRQAGGGERGRGAARR